MNTAFSDLDLPDPLLRALDKLGFDEPTPVQRAVIPPALEGRDLLVSAQTGSGKTASFLLPMLTRFLDAPAPDTATRALVLVPTRELARQVHRHFLELASFTRLTAIVVTGGEDRGRQVKALRNNPELVIGTPGRLLELLASGDLELGDLEVLVLDEADRMLDLGFAPDVLSIIAAARPGRQSMLFSATLRHKALESINEALLNQPLLLRPESPQEAHPDISHQLILADDPDHKRALLAVLLTEEPAQRVLVFTNTREQADRLGPFLVREEVRAAVLHGELDQRERKRTMGLLLEGRIRVLVATDVAARGLDIPGMDLVVNFDVPRSAGDYVHRSGRTGRAGQAGLAVSLVGPMEWKAMDRIAHYLRLGVAARTLKGLEARFKGPNPARRGKKLPAAERAVGSPAERASKPKVKERLRNRKNKGKRRAPSSKPVQGRDVGDRPLKRRGPAGSGDG